MSSYDEIRTETGTDEELDPTTPEGKDTLRRYEDDILGGLLAAASFKESEEETYPMEVARNGVVYFKFGCIRSAKRTTRSARSGTPSTSAISSSVSVCRRRPILSPIGMP